MAQSHHDGPTFPLGQPRSKHRTRVPRGAACPARVVRRHRPTLLAAVIGLATILVALSRLGVPGPLRQAPTSDLAAARHRLAAMPACATSGGRAARCIERRRNAARDPRHEITPAWKHSSSLIARLSVGVRVRAPSVSRRQAVPIGGTAMPGSPLARSRLRASRGRRPGEGCRVCVVEGSSAGRSRNLPEAQQSHTGERK